MEMEIIDESSLKKEYISLTLACELDDVDSSLSTYEGRCTRLGEIEDIVGEDVTQMWDKEIDIILSNPKTTYSSGCPYAKS